jgi:hypothetical protein
MLLAKEKISCSEFFTATCAGEEAAEKVAQNKRVTYEDETTRTGSL